MGGSSRLTGTPSREESARRGVADADDGEGSSLGSGVTLTAKEYLFEKAGNAWKTGGGTACGLVHVIEVSNSVFEL